MIVLIIRLLVPSLTVSAAEELTDYPLVKYADGVKLLGDAVFTDEGVSADSPLDGMAFYTDGGRVELAAQGDATFAVFVDARYDGNVAVTEGKRTVIADLSDETHRVELFLESGNAVITSLCVRGELAAVPKAPRLLVFDTAVYTVRDMVATAHYVGMDVKTVADETADVVIVDSGDEETLDERYPRARIVYVGEEPLPFTYTCEQAALAAYLRQTAVPAVYFDEIAAYVGLAEERLSPRPPAEPLAERLRLETDIAVENDNISGILFSLYGEVSDGPLAALLPERAERKMFNTFILTAVLVAVVGVALLTVSWVFILRKPKPTVCEAKKQKEESLCP